MSKIKYPPIKSNSCPVCHRPYISKSKNDQARSRDHIYPRCYGSPVKGVNNLRYMCVRCNGLRGHVGHCVGALVSVLAIADNSIEKPTTIIKKLKFFALWTQTAKPFTKTKDCKLEGVSNELGIS